MAKHNQNSNLNIDPKPSPYEVPHAQLYADHQAGFLPSQPVSQSLINYNHITYALAMLSYFTAGLTWIIPIVMNYLKRDEARGTWLYSHFDWQIKTFWYSVFFGSMAIVLIFFGFGASLFGLLAGSSTVAGGSGIMGMLGMVLLGFVVLWHLYRMIRGWIALANGRAVP